VEGLKLSVIDILV